MKGLNTWEASMAVINQIQAEQEKIETIYVGSTYINAKGERLIVDKMYYHAPLGEGDKHYVDIHLEDGETVRALRVHGVWFKENDND